MLKEILLSTLMSAKLLAQQLEQQTGEVVLAKLDLDLEKEDFVPDTKGLAEPVFGTYNEQGFSPEADKLGRVRLKIADEFISAKMKVDPARAARLPKFFYWPPSFLVSRYPTDEAKEFAWLNFNDRYFISPLLGVKELFAYSYARKTAPNGLPIPPSMLSWNRLGRLVNTKAYDWGFSDMSAVEKDLEWHWQHLTTDDNDPRIPN